MKLANFSLLIFLAASASGFHIPFKHRAPGTAPSPKTNDVYHFNSPPGYPCIGEITLDGQKFEVELSTGFSDLWLPAAASTFPSATATNIQQTLTFINGSQATGQILLGSLKLGDWTTKDQAFISAPFGNYYGILGIGPNFNSLIASALKGTQYNSNSFLDNIFEAHPNEPQILTFLFSRDETTPGNLTIGTLLEGYESIASTHRFLLTESYGWETLMDGVTINGTSYLGKNLGYEGDKIPVVLNTGMAGGFAPRPCVDVLYSEIAGAKWNDSAATYNFPCDSKIEVSMVFGDKPFFIHPIDLSTPFITGDGSISCAGTFVVNPKIVNKGLIFGINFLRNVYSVFFFGRWTPSGKGDPYVQFLSVTERDKAILEFPGLNAARLDVASRHSR